MVDAVEPAHDADCEMQEFILAAALFCEQNLYPVPGLLSVHDLHVMLVGARTMPVRRVLTAAE